MNKPNQSFQGLAFLRRSLKPEFSSMLILAALFIITASLQDNFFTVRSFVRNMNSFAPLILLAMGAAVVMISGGLDLSAGAALSLFTCVLATIMKNDLPITGLYAILVTFTVAVLVGTVNGIGIGYLRIPPVIVTFATSYMWLGIALFLRPSPGGEATEWFKIFYNPGWVEGVPPVIKNLGGILPPAFILVILACVVWFILSKTNTGRYIYAVGSSNESAYASGINTARIQLLACIINSVFIFLAALFFVAQNQSGDARMGGPLTLQAIASAIVGGVALAGGRGNVYFALVGALILNFVNRAIFFANISHAYQTLVSGLIVIVAIAAPVAYTLHNKESL